jgi:hypothetical protein
MNAHHLANDKSDTANLRYRDDNQAVIPIGFEDRLGEQLQYPVGCTFKDVTDVTKESNLVDTRNEKVRYFATYQGCSWRTTTQGTRLEVDFVIDIAFFDVMSRFGISSLSTWKVLWPAIRQYFKCLVMGCEDAERTFNIQLVRERLALSDNPEFINESAGKDQISFAVNYQPRGVIFDPVAIVTSISLPVSPKTIREYYWNGDGAPPSVPQGVKPLKGIDPRLVNLSESRDQHSAFDHKDFSLHLLTNITLMDMRGNAQPLTVLGALSLEDGDRLARFLAACVLAGAANMPKQEYLDNLADTDPDEHAKITPNSPINRYIFNAPQNVIINIYAVNRAIIEEDKRIFTQKISRLKLAPMFLTAGTLTTPGIAPPPVVNPPNMQIEEVHSPARAKSPERAAKRTKSPERAVKRKKDVLSEASSEQEEEEGGPTKRRKKDTTHTKKSKVVEEPPPDRMQIVGEEDEEGEENGSVII